MAMMLIASSTLAAAASSWRGAGAPPGLSVGSPGGQVRAAPNVNVSRQYGNQAETAVAVNPTNPDNVVITSNLTSFSGLFKAYTFDGERHGPPTRSPTGTIWGSRAATRVSPSTGSGTCS